MMENMVVTFFLESPETRKSQEIRRWSEKNLWDVDCQGNILFSTTGV